MIVPYVKTTYLEVFQFSGHLKKKKKKKKKKEQPKIVPCFGIVII